MIATPQKTFSKVSQSIAKTKLNRKKPQPNPETLSGWNTWNSCRKLQVFRKKKETPFLELKSSNRGNLHK